MKPTILFILFALFASAFSSFAQNKQIRTAVQDTIQLQELVVKASTPVTKLEGDGMTVKISGTPLQKLGTATDVLGFIPGLSVTNGNVEVIGKGRPVIYVNGRKILRSNELEQMKSSLIKEVKVINNPGAKYSGNTNAVINITTVRPSGEGISLNSKTTFGVKDYLYGKEQLDLNYRKDGLDIFATLEYANNRSKGSGLNIQDTWTATHSQTNIAQKSKSKSQGFDGKIGFNYITRSKHNFGLYYSGSYTPTDVDSRYASEIWKEDMSISSSITRQGRDIHASKHIIDGFYSGKWGKWTSDAWLDILWRNNHQPQSTVETSGNGEDRNIGINDKVSSSLVAMKLNLSKPLLKGKLNIGAEFTSSSRKDVFYSDNDIIHNNNDRIRETSLDVYGEYARKIGKVSAQIGIRYEHTESNYYDNGVRSREQSRNYNELLPSIYLTLPVHASTFQLGYSRKYTQPAYSQLSSTVNYVNSNLFESGNPYLRPSYSNNLTLNYNFKWLIVNASYSNITGQIINSASEYEGNQEITLLKKINSPYSLSTFQILATLMPGYIGKIYYPVLTGGILGQSCRINFRDRIIHLDDPMGMIQFRNIVKISDSMMATANFQWRSGGDSDNITMGHSWQLDFSLTKSFNKHWTMQISANDILNTSHRKHYTIFSGPQSLYMEKDINMRKIELSVTYKFNTTKSRYKGDGAGKTEKGRL